MRDELGQEMDELMEEWAADEVLLFVQRWFRPPRPISLFFLIFGVVYVWPNSIPFNS
jgi:hypothetical protein